MSSDLATFLARIEEDTRKKDFQPREDFRPTPVRSAKIYTAFEDNWGKITYLPLFDKKSGMPYIVLKGVKEVRLSYEGYKNKLLFRILPKECYKDLTTTDTRLYEEACGYWRELNDMTFPSSSSGEEPKKILSWKDIGEKSYTILTGILRSQENVKGEKKLDFVDKPVTIIYPNEYVLNSLKSDMEAQISTMNGSKDWIPAIFNNKKTGRVGALTVNFRKEEKRYKTSFTFGLNSEYGTVVDPQYEIADECFDAFSDVLGDFLGWQTKGKSDFDENSFAIAIEKMKDLIKQSKKLVSITSDSASTSRSPLTTPLEESAPTAHTLTTPTFTNYDEDDEEIPIEDKLNLSLEEEEDLKVDPFTGLPLPF
jgi:hypothetical protein